MTRDAALSILRQNIGFSDPEPWVATAVRKGFTPVKATPVPRCPDCGGAPVRRLGQQIYYSTLIHMEECACGLIWADARIDPAVTAAHFERAYKGREYFLQQRGAIFAFLARWIDILTPTRGRVVDIGGAEGDLMHFLKQRRPDIHTTVCDVSAAATLAASRRFPTDVFTGSFRELMPQAQTWPWDTVVLSDVLYYEPDLAGFWAALPGLLPRGGRVIIRVPNKLWLIRLRQFFRRSRTQGRIKHLNNEHLYILTLEYLTRKLTEINFGHVEVSPSPLLARRGAGLAFRLAMWLARRTGWIVTPSLILTARKDWP